VRNFIVRAPRRAVDPGVREEKLARSGCEHDESEEKSGSPDRSRLLMVWYSWGAEFGVQVLGRSRG
jgi:hypothetical protein